MPSPMTGSYRDAEHARLAVEAEQLLGDQAALLEDDTSDAFQNYVAKLKTHVTALAEYVNNLPTRPTGATSAD